MPRVGCQFGPAGPALGTGLVRRRWFFFRRWLGLQLVCKPVGHDIEMFESVPNYDDSQVWNARCRRCHRIWPQVLRLTFNPAAPTGAPHMLRKEVEKTRVQMRHARVMSRREERAMVARLEELDG